MNRTKIEWTDFSWNPITGCTKRCSYCYAWKLAAGRLRRIYLANLKVASDCDPYDPFSPRFWPDRLDEPLKRKKGIKIFVVDMGDFLDPYVSYSWREKVLDVVRHCPQHIFQFLTKQPKKLAEHDWPENAWVGITANDGLMAYYSLGYLRKVNASVKFISFEPLFGEISVDISELDWIIIGAQTKPEQQPERTWVEGILRNAGDVPVFMKDNLKWPNRRREWPTVRSLKA